MLDLYPPIEQGELTQVYEGFRGAMVARLSSEQKVTGSIPVGSVLISDF